MKIKIMRIGKGVAALLLCLLIVASMSFGAIPAVAASVDLSDLPEPGDLIAQTSVPDQGDHLVFHLTEAINVDRTTCIRFVYSDPDGDFSDIVESLFFDWVYEDDNYVGSIKCLWYNPWNYTSGLISSVSYHTLVYSPADLTITVLTEGDVQYFPGTYSPVQIFIEKGDENMGTSVVSSIVEVFTAVGEWIFTTLGNVGMIFYAPETGLTFIGAISLFGAGVATIYGMVALIRSWVKRR